VSGRTPSIGFPALTAAAEAVSGRTPSIGFPALTAAAEELVPLVEKDAAEAERLCRQTDRVVASRG
jgi:hypothetical protein